MKFEKKHYYYIAIVLISLITIWYFFLRKKTTSSSYNPSVPIYGSGMGTPTESSFGGAYTGPKSAAWAQDAQAIVATTFSIINFVKSKGNTAYVVPINEYVDMMTSKGSYTHMGGYGGKMSQLDAQAIVATIFDIVRFAISAGNTAYVVPIVEYADKMTSKGIYAGPGAHGYGGKMPQQEAQAIVNVAFQIFFFVRSKGNTPYVVPINDYIQKLVELYNPSIYPPRNVKATAVKDVISYSTK